MVMNHGHVKFKKRKQKTSGVGSPDPKLPKLPRPSRGGLPLQKLGLFGLTALARADGAAGAQVHGFLAEAPATEPMT